MTSRTTGSPAQTCSSMPPTTAWATVRLGSTPLWFDEIATDRASGLPWGGLWRLLHTTDANLGLYYAVLHLWHGFGDGALWLRLPSALAGVGAVVLTERVGRRLVGRWPALLGAGLLFAGTETGVYLSYDAGANWQPFSRNLPVVPVWAVDADGHFARPGPRLVDGVEVLAGIFHPEAYEPSPHCRLV